MIEQFGKERSLQIAKNTSKELSDGITQYKISAQIKSMYFLILLLKLYNTKDMLI